MSETLKFGNGQWATKVGSTIAYNDENGNFKPLPFTFTRSTSATRVNKNGLIEVVTNNKPRIDFLNDSNGALLLEPSRTNMFTDSEDISTWTNSGTLTRTYNIAVAPDGQTTADGIQDETGVTFKNVYKQVSVSTNSTITGSVFVKKVSSEANYMGITLFFTGGTSKVAYGIINSVTGTIVSASSTITPTFKVDDYGDYWRFSITATDNGSNTLCRLGVYACLSTDGTTLSVGVSSVRTIWGAQLESAGAGVSASYLTSYIPTQSAAVTRVAEVCNNSGNAQVFGDSEGVLYAEIAALADDLTERVISLQGASSSDRVSIQYNTITNEIKGLVRVGGTFVASLEYTVLDITDFHKVVLKYKLNDFQLWIDGFLTEADASGVVFAENTLIKTSFDIGGAAPFYGKTKQLQCYNLALTDAQLEDLTSWDSFEELAASQSYILY